MLRYIGINQSAKVRIRVEKFKQKIRKNVEMKKLDLKYIYVNLNLYTAHVKNMSCA